MSRKNTAANKPKPATVAPASPATTTGATETVQVTGKVVNDGNAVDDALKTQELDKSANATALRLQGLNEDANANPNINTENKDSDKGLAQKAGSVTDEDAKTDSEEEGNPENKVAHELSGKLVYETAADYQASLKRDK